MSKPLYLQINDHGHTEHNNKKHFFFEKTHFSLFFDMHIWFKSTILWVSSAETTKQSLCPSGKFYLGKASVISHQRLLPPKRCHSQQTDSLTFPPYYTSKRAEIPQNVWSSLCTNHFCMHVLFCTRHHSRIKMPFLISLIPLPNDLDVGTNMFSGLQRLE